MLADLRTRLLPGALSSIAALALMLSVALTSLTLWLIDPIPLQSLRLVPAALRTRRGARGGH